MREGEYGRDRIPVVSHVTGIPERLKELDDGYFVMFNKKKQRFEIWHRGYGEGMLECVLPYDELDERTIRHVREHRMERMEQLIREIDEHNARLEEEARKKWLDEAGDRTREAFGYLRNKSDTDEIPQELMRLKGDNMNLGRMCEAAARCSDRYDEYTKNGEGQFEGEAMHWFHLFRDAVNEAYFEIARCVKQPQAQIEVELGADRVIDMTVLEPEAVMLTGVYRADGRTEAEFVFRTRQIIEVIGAQAGERVIVKWQYLPARLETEKDEPEFSEALADPMIYIALAAARMWQSERRMSDAQIWVNEYYRRLRELRPTMKPARKRRLPRTLFR